MCRTTILLKEAHENALLIMWGTHCCLFYCSQRVWYEMRKKLLFPLWGCNIVKKQLSHLWKRKEYLPYIIKPENMRSRNYSFVSETRMHWHSWRILLQHDGKFTNRCIPSQGRMDEMLIFLLLAQHSTSSLVLLHLFLTHTFFFIRQHISPSYYLQSP